MAIIPKQVLMGWETVVGVTPTTPTPYQMCFKENGITYKRETAYSSCMGGSIDSGGQQLETGITVGGNLIGNAYWEQLGVYFKSVLGSPVTVDNGDGTFTHTFDTTKDTLPSMYIETISGADNLVEVVNGAYGSKLDFSLVGKGIMDMTLAVIAHTHKDNLKDAYTKINDTGKIPLGSSNVKLSKSFIKLNNVDFCKFSEISFSFDRGMNAMDLLCDKKEIDLTKSELSGNIKAVWDNSFYQRVAQNTVSKIEAGVIDGSNSLSIIMAEVEFGFETSPKKVNEKVLINTTFSATRSGTGTERAKVVLKNTVAIY